MNYFWIEQIISIIKFTFYSLSCPKVKIISDRKQNILEIDKIENHFKGKWFMLSTTDQKLTLVRKVQSNMQKSSNLDIAFRFKIFKLFWERLSPDYAGMWACVPKNISILTGTFGWFDLEIYIYII